MINKEAVFTKDEANKKMTVTRNFDAPLDSVWQAWTDSTILDQWWAPRPWKAETKEQDFREGGHWLYAMVGPEDERHYSLEKYKTIRDLQSISSDNGFSDENGVPNPNMAVMHWVKSFTDKGDHTTVQVDISFDDEAGMKQFLDMGFQGGFTMGLNNLDEYLASKK